MDKRNLLKSYLHGYYKIFPEVRASDDMHTIVERFLNASKELPDDEFALKIEREFPEARILHDSIVLKRLTSIDSSLKFFKVLSIISIIITALAVIISAVI